MRSRVKSGYGGWEENQTSAGREESNWGEPEKQELEKTRKKQHTWQLSLNVDMLSLLTYAHKNLGNNYTLLTNSGTPPSLYYSLQLL
jgi:hypothetical protein